MVIRAFFFLRLFIIVVCVVAAAVVVALLLLFRFRLFSFLLLRFFRVCFSLVFLFFFSSSCSCSCSSHILSVFVVPSCVQYFICFLGFILPLFFSSDFCLCLSILFFCCSPSRLLLRFPFLSISVLR